MFDISGTELLTILVVALVVFGPQRLPELARRVGKWTAEVRKAARELRAGLEAEVEDLQKPLKDLQSEVEGEFKATKASLESELTAIGDDVTAPLEDIDKAISQPLSWVGPEPESGPSPADAEEDLRRIERGEIPSDRPEENTA